MEQEERLTMTPEQAAMYAERGRKLTELRKLHRKDTHALGDYCKEDGYVWPCRTIRIIEETR